MSIANIDFTAGSRVSGGAGRAPVAQANVPLEALKAYQQLTGGVSRALGSVPRSNVDLASQIRSFADFSKPVKRKPGLLQQILSTGPVKYALKPLEVIDVPRRVVISGLKEIADAFGSGDASLSDFAKQASDPSFGVGRFVNTGNKWLDRIAGFTGDVLLDPVTYLTLGAGKFAGLSGRQALAMRLAGRGATEELVQKAGRLGINALTTAERELAGVAPAGLRFAGKRIAGTERFAEAVGKGLSTTRAAVGGTKVGGALRRARTPEEFADLIEKLATGRGAVSATQAAQTLDANIYRKGAQGQVLSQIVKDFEPLRQKLNASGRAQEITHLVERGVLDDELAQEVFTFLQNNRERMVQAGIDVGEIRDYVPHIWSAQGRELLLEDSKFAVDFQKAFNVTPSEIRNPTNVRTRQFIPEPGKVYEIGGKKLTFDGSTIQDINNVFRREFGFNVLEDNAIELIKGYSNNTARALGNKAFEDRLVLLGTGKAVGDVSEDVVDKAATKKATKEAKKQASEETKKAQAARDAQKKVVEDLRSQYRDTVRAAVKRIRDSFKGSKKGVDARIVALQKELNTFLTKNAADVVDLGSQAAALDDVIRQAKTYINEGIQRREELIARGAQVGAAADFVENSAVYRELQNNIEYAQQVVDEVTDIRTQLDDVVKKIDESIIDIPTPTQIGDDVERALNRPVSLTDGTNVQPYRAGGISPGTRAYNTKNAYEEFGQAHADAARTIGLVSPDAERLYNEAGELVDNAQNARASALNYEDDYNEIPLVETVHVKSVDAYDALYQRFVDATGQADEVTYGSLRFLSRKKLGELFNDSEQRIINGFEENLVKYNRIPEVRNNYINSAQSAQASDEMMRQAAAKRAQARTQALNDFAARLEATTAGGAWTGGYAGLPAQAGVKNVPTVSDNVKASVLKSFENMLNAFDESIPVMRTIRGKAEFTSQQAVVSAKNALAAKSALHDAATALRIQYDFVGRYSNAIDVLRSKGIEFDADAIAAKAGRNAISAEINRVNTNINQLLDAQAKVIEDAAKVIREGTVATKAADAADVVARKSAAERELVQNMESYTKFVQVYLEEYVQQRKLWNAATRGGSTARTLTADELAELGFDMDALGGLGNIGMTGVSGDTVSEVLADLRSSIELAIFGEQSVRKKGFNFDKFYKEVTTRSDTAGRPVVVDETKLRKWMLKNAVQGMTEKDINRLVTAGRLAKRQASDAPTVAGAIAEQIAELQSRKELLQQGAKTLGYSPRGSRLSAEDLARVQQYTGKGVDFDDPITIANEIDVLKTRRQELVGTVADKKLQRKLVAEQQLLNEFLTRTPATAPPNQILKGVNSLGSMTRAGAQKRLDEVTEIITGRAFGEIDRVDKAINATMDEIKALAKVTDVKLSPEGRRRIVQLNNERSTLQAQIDAGQFSSARVGNQMSPLEKAQFRIKDIDGKIAAWEKRYTVYSGDESVAKRLNDRLVSLRSQKAKLESELSKVDRDTKFLSGILNGRFFDRKIGLPVGKATRNWEAVLFSGGLGKTRYGFQQQFARQRVSLLAREMELQDALKLPNQSVVANTVRELDDAIAKLGDKKAIIKRIKELEKEKSKLTPKAVKTREKIDANIAKLRTSLENIDENIARRQQLSERLAGGREVEAAQEAKAAQDAFQPVVAGVQRARERGQQMALEGEFTGTLQQQIGQRQFDEALAARNQIQEQIDNTKRVAVDANVEFQNQRTELLRIASDFENRVLAARMENAPRKAEELGQWLDTVYALYDPIGYQARVGASAAQGNDLAAQIVRLQAMPDSQEKYVVLSLIAQAQRQEADLLLESATLSRLNQMVDAAKNPEFPKIMKQQLIEGWQALPGNRVAVPTEVAKAMERFMRIDSPSEWRKFTQMWESYTDLFKSYATLSPRFHIRNGLSASLMNFADGVTGRNAVDGAKYWRLAKADPENWWKSLPADEQRIATDAVLAVYAAGAGQYAEMSVGRGTRNRVVTASRNIGTDVEGSVRMGMALDTIRGGGDVTEAASRIARIHFNYGDVSKLDKMAKRVIPFWTFMSRNIPLQMQQIWLKPRVYQLYATSVRNFRGEDNGQIVPSYYDESDMFRSPIGGGFIRPDLAWSGLESQVRQATTARGLMGQANPLVRVPIELFAGQKAFSSAPLSEGEAPMYALESALPFLNTIRTLTGTKPTSAEGASPEAKAAGESSKLQRDINAWLSYLGIPYVQPTVSQQRGEILRRKALLDELMKVSKQ